MSEQTATPSSHWRAEGQADPYAGHYDCERAALAMGNLTDDELANAAFANYDVRSPLQDIIAGKAYSPIAYMTAAKDRIRWLSRSLEKATSELATESHNHECTRFELRAITEDRDALAAALKASRDREPGLKVKNAIGGILAEAMNEAARNGANSVSMPDEYVEVAAWLSGLKPLTNAADSVLAERRRQIEAEGYSPDHDDDHTAGELAQAAADLCVDGTDFRVVDPDGDEMLGWGLTEAHRSDRRRQLVIAGALVLAEIERIDRAHIASKEKK